MNSNIEKSLELHKKGYNCSQAVLCSYCEKLGLDIKTAFKLSEGFGAGMGIQSVCGALTGLLMLVGLQNSSGTSDVLTKSSTYKTTKELAKIFEKNIGSIYCAEIKGLNGKPVLKSCSACIENACEIFEEYMSKNSTAKI